MEIGLVGSRSVPLLLLCCFFLATGCASSSQPPVTPLHCYQETSLEAWLSQTYEYVCHCVPVYLDTAPYYFDYMVIIQDSEGNWQNIYFLLESIRLQSSWYEREQFIEKGYAIIFVRPEMSTEMISQAILLLQESHF